MNALLIYMHRVETQEAGLQPQFVVVHYLQDTGATPFAEIHGASVRACELSPPVGLGAPDELAVFAQSLVCQVCQMGTISSFKCCSLGSYNITGTCIICI